MTPRPAPSRLKAQRAVSLPMDLWMRLEGLAEQRANELSDAEAQTLKELRQQPGGDRMAERWLANLRDGKRRGMLSRVLEDVVRNGMGPTEAAR